jgi:hypothetical protein
MDGGIGLPALANRVRAFDRAGWPYRSEAGDAKCWWMSGRVLTYRVECRLPGMAEVVMFRPRRNARAARGTAGTDDETMTARLDLLSAILDMSPRLPRNDR